MPTPQTQAIGNANSIIALSAQMASLFNAITALNNSWNDDGSLTIINALATAPQNTDGSLGTADGTPQTAHPIDTRVSANSGLSRAVSANTLTSALTQLNNIAAFINGGALSATPGVRALFNQLNGS